MKTAICGVYLDNRPYVWYYKIMGNTDDMMRRLIALKPLVSSAMSKLSVTTGVALIPFKTTAQNKSYLLNFKSERHFEKALALWWILALERKLTEPEMNLCIKGLVYWSERHRCVMYCLKLYKPFVDG